MIKKVLLVSVVFLGLLGQGLAQTRSLTLDEMFQLADQNNNRIRLYDLAISEAEQGVKVACNDRLPSIQAHVELNYIGDGVMTDRNFAHAVHADMPHFGNSFVLKASQVIYAGGAVAKGNRTEQVTKEGSRTGICRKPPGYSFSSGWILFGSFPVKQSEACLRKQYFSNPLAGKGYEGVLSSGNGAEE
jgi:hypothetical protein